MATISDIRVAPGFFNLINVTLHAQIARYAQYRVYRKTLNELETLSDRELNDLGLSSLSLRDVAYEAAYGFSR